MSAPFRSHLPLLAFTAACLGAAGLALGAALGGPAPILPGAALVLTGTGGLASFLHLGQKARAPRVITGLGHSWLSREALLAGFFGGALGGALLWPTLLPLAAGLGLALASSIAFLYRLEAQPVWKAWPTLLAPLSTVCLLGLLAAGRRETAVFLGLADLLLLALRWRLQRRPGPAWAHPELASDVTSAFVTRLNATAVALLVRQPWASLAFMGVALLADRFILYAGARPHHPTTGIAAEKAARMARALEG